ncbi:MAG: HAMP domain-containing histidine kinase, partial [Chloroflexi bacterium]|nr:HAMP domain-containing histidine kinase [Chloroflexota bacterium]
YVALISHDLRNQLTSLMGHAQLLFRTLAKKGLATEAASAESILVSSTRMNSMIQELVESAHLESGQPELNREPVDLFEMVSDIAGRVGTAEDAARIRLERQNHVPLVAVDIERFERVITNLLTNALKYSSPDAAVLARISSDDGRAIVSVQDQGIGIPTQDLPYLFQRFFRAKTGKKADGLGLGLYITRLLVEAHQGHVWVESEVGKGSTFYVALPFFQNSS